MSIIETAYGEQIAARLCEFIDALGAATTAYQTTGDALASATDTEYDTRATAEYAETICRWTQHAKGVPGKNEAERKVNLDMYVLDEEEVRTPRKAWETARAVLNSAERAHKNASAEMMSLSVAIQGYAAVLGATMEGTRG